MYSLALFYQGLARAVSGAWQPIGRFLARAVSALQAEERRLQRLPSWLAVLSVGVGAWAVGAFFNYPAGFLYLDHFPRLEDFFKLCANPLARDLDEPIMAYRVVVPFLCWAFRLGAVAAVALQFLFLMGAYGLVYLAFKRRDLATVGLAAAVALSFTHFAHWSNRWLGYMDSFSYLTIAACLVSRNRLAQSAFFFLGCLNDERSVIALPFVLLWHVGNVPWPASLRVGLRASLPYLLALFAVLVVRQTLTVGIIGSGIQRPAVYAGITEVILRDHRPYASSWSLFALNVFMGLRALWLLPLVAFLFPSALSPFARLMGALALFAGAFSTFVVIDVSRSQGFLFPAVLVAALGMARVSEKGALLWLVGLSLMNFFIPNLYYCQKSGAVFLPLPFDMLNSVWFEVSGKNLMQTLKPFLKP